MCYVICLPTVTTTCYYVNGIGTLNPFRYRGYYFDEETGLYYLQSRYYDAEVVVGVVKIEGACIDMGTVTSQLPSATNVYWTKEWYQIGRIAIKVIE